MVELSNERSGGELGVTWVIGCSPDEDLRLALTGDRVDRDRRDAVSVRVVQRRVHERRVGDIPLGDLARLRASPRRRPGGRVGIAVHGDRRIGLVAAGAVDLGERVGQLRRVLDAHVLERAEVGLEIAERRRVRRAEGSGSAPPDSIPCSGSPRRSGWWSGSR